MPVNDAGAKLDAYFRSLLSDLDDDAIVAHLVSAVRDGAATLTVHPRGEVEIARANKVLKSHDPVHLFLRVAPAATQGGLLGERAAGPP
ncbi:MAG: hypothetical protein ABIT36_10600 [Steroidobacteraceae bacterium]